jgi:hypothetical protein
MWNKSGMKSPSNGHASNGRILFQTRRHDGISRFDQNSSSHELGHEIPECGGDHGLVHQTFRSRCSVLRPVLQSFCQRTSKGQIRARSAISLPLGELSLVLHLITLSSQNDSSASCDSR